MPAIKARTTGPQKARRTAGSAHGRQPSKAERAYRELRRRILDNDLPGGSRHSEQQLAAMVRSDVASTRKALSRLAEERLVDASSRAAVRILPISVDDMRDIFDIMVALEPIAARDAARRDPSRSDLERLAATIQQMDAALLRNDLLAWAKADELFHTRLIDLCSNRRIAAVLAKCHDHRHRARMQTLGARPLPVDSNRDHAAVVDAVRRGDAEAAYSLHHDHLARSSHMMITLLRAPRTNHH